MMIQFDEAARLEKMSFYENEFYSGGAEYIAGVDEVGRGSLAGPVLACAVILPKKTRIEGVNDSKKLTPAKREKLSKIITAQAVFCFAAVDPLTIDTINIYNASLKAMTDAVNGLKIKPDAVLIDAMRLPDVNLPQRSIIHGDALSVTVAAASILAKVKRDGMMDKYHEIYPEYGFNKNKGYGTRSHIIAIGERGLCPVHRVTFSRKFVKF